MPDEKIAPAKTALAVRAYLMVRLAMHTGLRQRNLRELLLCMPGRKPRSSHDLEGLEQREIRWSREERHWEIFIPACAFKNSGSPFFHGRPYHIVLPQLDNLYRYIEDYIERHRPLLMGGRHYPDTFFVRTFRSAFRCQPHDVSSFYDAWMDIIQRYGIHNPYTGKGAIIGLLPHGPHSVRDVIATHILKQTGSYELAGFALQDTTAAVMRHYSRFAPHEKTAMAADILNDVWQKKPRRQSVSSNLNASGPGEWPRPQRGKRRNSTSP